MARDRIVDAGALVRSALGAGSGDGGADFGGRASDDQAGADAQPGWSLSGEVAAWSDEDLLSGLADVEALARHVEVWRGALAVQVDERSGRGADSLARSRGCRTSRELIRRVTGAAQSSVSRWIRLGRATQESTALSGAALPATFPYVADALRDGRLNIDAALSIVDNLNPVRGFAGAAAVQVAEEELVGGCAAEHADGVPPVDADSARIQAATWAAFLDQDGTEPAETELAHRSLKLGGLHHGLVRLSGLLLPEVAASLRAYADACTNPRTPAVPDPSAWAAHAAGECAAGDFATAAGGEETAGPTAAGECTPDESDHLDSAATNEEADVAPDPRTAPQLMHDILAMALQAAGRIADRRSLAGNSPTVLVATRASDLAAGHGTGVVFTGDTLGGQVPLSMAAVRQLACAGAIQRVAFDDAGAVVGLWSPERCFTGHQRRAITLRDGGCVIPGCHVPAGWCEVHHVTPHDDDPDGTHTDNGVLLCWYHHRTIDTSGWQIRMRENVPELRPPAWLRTLTDARPGNPATERVGSNRADGDRAGSNRAGADRAGRPSSDDGWRRAAGSPARMLDALCNHHTPNRYRPSRS
ncbi:DUF222 domain-containing protein [Cellulomonas sp. JH27-2]|uniref:HNH endonuclease signature motif containing protein n=1 Tax=Cellulomonas sp. JH27-2 TaxID=2774139 RepID=UPI00177B8E99|nr:HNH endonuclease signature motif containing protein [Cellulomonas sp. JH27-2]MBD8058081.1 DUF222 domain-containing protein [Cellulomonas sp. JH27-2]